MAGKKCQPGCTCGLHSKKMPKCPPGCACGRHSNKVKKCQPGCTCKKHQNTFSNKCAPGCTCSKHKKHPPGCECGSHAWSHELRKNHAEAQQRRWQNTSLEERLEFGVKVSESMTEKGLVSRSDDKREYHRNHVRVNTTRGSAKIQKCELCGSDAAEWSQIHNTDGTDPQAHYRPLCRPCHSAYDYDVKVPKMIKAITGQKRSAESRAKMSESAKNRRRKSSDNT